MTEPLDEGPLVDAPDEMAPEEPEKPQYFFRPTGWRVEPKVGIFDRDGNLLSEIAQEPMIVYFPHGQNLHLLQESCVERARQEFEAR
jgi:hypothetical protein